MSNSHGRRERWALKIASALACVVPIVGGLAGVVRGPALFGGSAGVDEESHFRYLSGLLLGIGLVYASVIPTLERQTRTVRVLTTLVLVGGLARLASVLVSGWPSAPMCAALGMELVVTPCLALWQARVARNAAANA